MTEEKIISREEIKKIAALARIEIDSKEEKKFAQEIGSILEYFKDISGVDTAAQEKFDHFKLKQNQFRADEVEDTEDVQKEAIRQLFPNRKGDHLKVKEVLNGSH